ncbi:RNA polymerase Rpb4 family protein [Methanobrevibacter sp.]|uniref:RNA polymerase Rpb4 family protein n=1 Tax=Methanobrevibacter sp. TaxID=66852 RepID=UPI0026E0DD72|nr:RNA polymerase Rpb4 family protein [Methanobrevibacter sp.]MDO5824039.1 RNA polymerase Rpb4 family protein [Methanobrevibacter sp.]
MISMIGKEIIESEPIHGAEVKKVLEDYSQDNELTYEQNIALNHISRFKRYSLEDSQEIFEKLQSEFDLRSKVAAHIVDLAPKDLADLRLIFAKEPVKIENETMEKILEFLEQYSLEE